MNVLIFFEYSELKMWSILKFFIIRDDFNFRIICKILYYILNSTYIYIYMYFIYVSIYNWNLSIKNY